MAERKRGVGSGLSPSMTSDAKVGSDDEQALLLFYKSKIL